MLFIRQVREALRAGEVQSCTQRKNTDETGCCLWCGEYVTDQSEEAGAPETSSPAWATQDGDYGCDQSPETCTEGCGSHALRSDAAGWLLALGKKVQS